MPEDVGLSAPDFARVMGTAKSKNLDFFTEMVKHVQSENPDRSLTSEDIRGIGAFIYPQTDAKMIAMSQTMKDLQIKNENLIMDRNKTWLDNERNGVPLTTGQLNDVQKDLATHKPVVAAAQKIDNLWDTASKPLTTYEGLTPFPSKDTAAIRKAQDEIRTLLIPLMGDPEARTAAMEIGQGRFDAGTRQDLKNLVTRRLPLVLSLEKVLSTGRQQRGGTGTAPEAIPTDPAEDDAEYLKSLGLGVGQ